MNQKISNVRVISLDIWETVVKPNKEYSLPRTLLVAKYLNFSGDPAELLKVIKTVNKQADKESDLDGIERGFGYRVNAMFKITSCNDLAELPQEDLGSLENDLAKLVKIHPPLLLEEDFVSTLKELRKRGYTIAVISNTGFLNGRHMKIALDGHNVTDYVDHLIFSDEVGVSKPDPRIFKSLMDLAGVCSEQILHVGDNYLADYEGAKAAGLRTALLQNEKNATHAEGRLSISSIRSLLDVM